ncbi:MULTISPECIES: MsnO8 family LLM class oxidoreductase [Clostridia]|uniref:MsnO8 family LLM class oxidoreductase n=1 Tax=Clostridia TaxID=186801 RepID=UPI000EA13ACB|nr:MULTISPECIES: MsnO8 family LLM class oxidoreductase [Clostridia]NBJ71501.1 MsnO8 family LLM class oxidoreductase [Roseburia sp. 1XD42-34]RKI74325.1 MsnO8 family LLM class oxidoreductase [Clostridium sp. 1xD42-85]
MKLSILDQVPVLSGAMSRDAILSTLELAEMAERFGFTRYWVAEHHDMKRFACPAPDILLGLIGSRTKKIRIGAGAVLLPHYRPYNITERYNVLATLYPKRVDVGIGRAPGGSAEATIALSGNFLENVKKISADIDELVAFFQQTFTKDHLYANVAPTPIPNFSPDLWLLGTSEKSAKLAAEKGMSYAFGHFMTEQDGPAIVDGYRKRYNGKVIIAVSVICAPTSEAARKLAERADIENKKFKEKHISKATSKAVRDRDRSKGDVSTEGLTAKYILGNPEQVHKQLQSLQKIYQADEIMILTNTPDYESRKNSYRLIAQACL